MTKLLEVVNNKFKFNEILYSIIDDNIYCLIDITVKKLQYDNLKIYYDISYKYINSVDNEICKNLNPLLDLKINDQPYTGDIIVSNSFTDELIKYLLMPYEELSNYSGHSTPEYYKRQIIKTISLFLD